MPPDQHNPYAQQPQQPAGPQPVIPAAPPIPAPGNNGHSGHNPYEFIVAQNTPRKKWGGFSLPGGNSLLGRAIIFVAGAVVLVVIASVVLSLLTPKSATPALTAVAQRQQEIVRVSALAVQKATDQDTRNFVANVNLSMASGQNQVVTFLSQHGAALTPQVLALKQNSQTDTLLGSATSADAYDTAVVQNLTSQLQTYEQLLRTAYSQTSNPKTKALLQTCFASAQQLLAQAGEL